MPQEVGAKRFNAPGFCDKIKQEMAECASGSSHSLYLDPLGSVWSCGSNQFGQLGLGNTKTITPQKINKLPPIISVSAGHWFSLFVGANGSVWSCGNNLFGKLGLGEVKDRHVPEQIKNLPKIISASALRYSSIFLDCEGSVWACGYNQHGELGLGDNRGRSTAEKIEGLPAIKSIAGGRNFSMFVDEQGNVWVCGGNKKGGLGLGHTTPIRSPQKNHNVSGIVAVAGGYGNYSVFLDNAGNIYTCGSNEYGQLGSGDKNGRLTPQKVTNIPRMSCISSCNAAMGYLQVVDEEGRVWSCGKNNFGQLGLGHANATLTFQRTGIIVKLKQHKEQANNQEKKEEAEVPPCELHETEKEKETEKEMFKSIEKEQNKQVMDKITNMHFHPVNKEQAKQKIIEGVIGMADWSSKWQDIHAKNQQLHQLHQCIEQHKANLNNKQQHLNKLTQEVKEIKQALCNMEEYKEVVEFFEVFLKPIAEAEKELKSGFEEKLHAGKHGEWTMDEVSLFLNVCEMETLVIHQREKKIDGNKLKVAMEDVTVMEIKDKLAKKKMKFYLKVLKSGKMLNEQELSQSMVWRHRDVEQTLLLMKEWEIALNEELVRKKRISVCELLYFNAKDFKEELGVEMEESVEIVGKLKRMRKEFERFLKNK